ncbi:MAG TPA: hypothetical protein VIW80_11135 [Pyrinomonadaceae bacterium]
MPTVIAVTFGTATSSSRGRGLCFEIEEFSRWSLTISSVAAKAVADLLLEPFAPFA